MAQVICTSPNASEEISGVKFSRREAGGMISEEISDEQAAFFVSIPGYKLATISKAPASTQTSGDGAQTAEEKAAAEAKAAEEAQAAAEAAAAERVALVARAAAVELKVKANWSLDRLRSEVEAAEKAKADAAAGGNN